MISPENYKVEDHKEFEQMVKIKVVDDKDSSDVTTTNQYSKKSDKSKQITQSTSGNKINIKKHKSSSKKDDVNDDYISSNQDKKDKLEINTNIKTDIETDSVFPDKDTVEDRVGFIKRRPIKDPFRAGEQVVLDISYFGVSAGDLTLKTNSFVLVNGRKSYHFILTLKTNNFFSKIYLVDDAAETHVDFERLLPWTFQVHVKESKKLKEMRSFFDWPKLKATYWEREVIQDESPQEKKKEWTISPWSQNVFSAVFYLRALNLEVDKKLAFRVADDEKNLVFTAVVLRRETINTDLGEFKTLVVKPQITARGVFQQTGDILFWLTDDDRKFIVKLSAKIKIGTIIGELKTLKK